MAAAATAASAAMSAPTVSTAWTSATTGAASFALRTSFIYNQRASEKIFAVESRDCLFSFRIIPDFREAESARLPGKTVAQQRK
jgi:hypothetical protein